MLMMLCVDCVCQLFCVIFGWLKLYFEFVGCDFYELLLLFGNLVDVIIDVLCFVGVIYFVMDEVDVECIIWYELMMVGLDGLFNDKCFYLWLWGMFL